MNPSNRNWAILQLLAALLFWPCALLVQSGCGITSRLETAAKAAPNFVFKAPATPAGPGAEIQQTGLAATPATVNTAATVTEIPMQPGATITITAAPRDGGSARPEALPVIRVTDRREHVTTPTAYAPPAGPTLSEITDADAVRRSYYYAAALVALAALLAYRAHAKAAIVAGLAALAVVPVTKFIGSAWGQGIVIAGICVAGALFAAWHFMEDRRKATPAPAAAL